MSPENSSLQRDVLGIWEEVPSQEKSRVQKEIEAIQQQVVSHIVHVFARVEVGEVFLQRCCTNPEGGGVDLDYKKMMFTQIDHECIEASLESFSDLHISTQRIVERIFEEDWGSVVLNYLNFPHLSLSIRYLLIQPIVERILSNLRTCIEMISAATPPQTSPRLPSPLPVYRRQETFQ